MTEDVELACRCGEVHGWARGLSRGTVNRAVCYCADCQAFLHYLGRAELVDAQGGSDIVQVAPRAVAFDRGTERIVGVRLTSKGMHRWYAGCCKTPLGNTLTPSIPFIGMLPEVFSGVPDARRRDEVFGRSRGGMFGQHAIGVAPEGSTKVNLAMLAHVMPLVLGWKLSGKTWPHPFFDRRTRAPSYPVSTLAPSEREALRPKCGPKPGVVGAQGST